MRAVETSEQVELPSLLLSGKVLLADDSLVQRVMLTQILEGLGLDVVTANDGQEAVEHFSSVQPDLIIMDIEMPNMDGIEAAQIIVQQIEGYIPIVFVTGSDSKENLRQCVELGCDDFIARPYNPDLLTAKIRSLLRTKSLYDEQVKRKTEIEAFQEESEREAQVAANLYDRIIRENFFETPALRYSLSPAAMFNGDLLISAKSPSGQLYVMLGDFTGHGMSASIGAGPTAEIFYGMTRKGFDISEIVSEINRKLQKILPVDIFLAACFFKLDPVTKTLDVCTGGLPEHYLINSSSRSITIIASTNLPLGIIRSEQLTLDIQHFNVAVDDVFLVFTDGLIEAENQEGTQFGFDRVVSLLKNPDVSTHFQEELSIAVRDFSGGRTQQDDITIVEYLCDIDLINQGEESGITRHPESKPSQWTYSFGFNADTLKQFDPVPLITNTVIDIQGLQNHRETIFTIVTELFINALDHGVLGLDSKLKSSTDGFFKYFEERQQRLEALQSGFVKASFTHEATENGGRLIIRMQDSGVGFDYKGKNKNGNEKNIFSGRGIALLSALCSSVEYLGEGNRVKVVYEWKMASS